MSAQATGRFFVGLVVGVLLGLALSLAVAIYVNKVPVPFVNKVPQRSAEQDAAEAERNKNWDANAPLAGKSPMRPAAPASAAAPAESAAPATATPAPSSRDPAAILAGRPVRDAPVAAAPVKPGTDPFIYFVQAGAYGRAEDAEQQRARLAMLGLAARITEREQSGRTVYRVRVGPFDRKEDAEAGRAKLESGGVEAALVRVQK